MKVFLLVLHLDSLLWSKRINIYYCRWSYTTWFKSWSWLFVAHILTEDETFFFLKFASQIIENLRKIQHLNQIMLMYWRKSISDTYTALDWTACLIFCSIREIGKKIAEKRECICDIFLVHAVHFIDLAKLVEAKLTKLGLTSNVFFCETHHDQWSVVICYGIFLCTLLIWW